METGRISADERSACGQAETVRAGHGRVKKTQNGGPEPAYRIGASPAPNAVKMRVSGRITGATSGKSPTGR